MKHIHSNQTKSSLSNVAETDVQPNAVDLRVDKVFLIRPNTMTLTEEEKTHRGSVELHPDQNGLWTLQPGSYEVVFDNIISVGEDEAGWVITRSTLNRNGVFLTSGLYDSGYNGLMAGCLHVNVAPLRIKKGTRIGQYIMFEAESLHLYDGDYGLGKQHDNKYNKE